MRSCMRYIFSAGASAGVLPLIQAIGVGPTNTIAAGLSWLGFGLVLLTTRKGQSWRRISDARLQAQAGVPPPSRDNMVGASTRTSLTLREK
jgi:hypothetical protein